MAAERGIELPPPPRGALRVGAVAALLGMCAIFCLLMGTGMLLLGDRPAGALLCLGGALSGGVLFKLWPRISGGGPEASG